MFELDRCFFHHLELKSKRLMEVGPFKLMRMAADANITFISVNKFVYCASIDTIIIRKTYDRTVSYLFEYIGGGFYSITVDNEPSELMNL